MLLPKRDIDMPHTNIPFVRNLSVVQELVYYDRPLCMLLSNRAGHSFLGHYLYYADQEFWFIVPIPTETIDVLLSGHISLRSAFETPPPEFRFIGALSSRDSESYIFDRFYSWEDINALNDFLPNSSFKFFKDEFEEYLQEEFEPVNVYAKKRLAEVIYHRLVGVLPNQFPVVQLAEIGTVLQRLITNFALHAVRPEEVGRRGSGAHSIELGSQYALTGISRGSVVLRLESIQPVELFADFSHAYRGTKTFVELLEIDNPQLICDRLTELPSRIRSTYIKYVTMLQKAHVGVNVSWGSPKLSSPFDYTWTNQTVAEVFQAVSKLSIDEDTTYSATGIFKQGNMDTGRFTFHDISLGRAITGNLSPDIEKDAITLSKREEASVLYDVQIREISKTSPTGAVQYEYTFLDVREV